MARLDALFVAVHSGDLEGAKAATESALAAGTEAKELLDDSLIPAMRKIGDDFEAGQAFVPEMLLAARAMRGALGLIEPALALAGVEPRGRVCIGTVAGDLHDIGKNLVAMMLRGVGFDVDDLGVDCAPARFVDAVDRGATVVCLSALLTTTMRGMRTIIETLERERPGTAVVIGGAPITPEFAESIGARGFAKTASGAIPEVERCMGIAPEGG